MVFRALAGWGRSPAITRQTIVIAIAIVLGFYLLPETATAQIAMKSLSSCAGNVNELKLLNGCGQGVVEANRNGISNRLFSNKLLLIAGLNTQFGNSGFEGRGDAAVIDSTDSYSGGNFVSDNGVDIPGGSASVQTISISGTDVYAGGRFETAGGVPAYYIAKWNGSGWSPLSNGVGLPGMNNTVFAVAVSGTDVYVAGDFSFAGGGVPASKVAKWNGITWAALGSGDINGRVEALAVSGTNVYIGGNFTTVNGVAANGIAKWDGTAWTGLGTGTGTNVTDLAVLGADVIASGPFYFGGSSPSYYIGKWNGSTWTSFGGGTPSTPNTARSFAVSGSDIYAAGEFFVRSTSCTTGSVEGRTVVKWDGTCWRGLGVDPGTGTTVAVSGSAVYAGGGNAISRWDGSSWVILGSGIQVNSVAVSGTDLYVGGMFATVNGVAANNIGKWDGSSWSAMIGAATSRTISGQVTNNGSAFPGVTVALSGTTTGNQTTSASGNYSFSNLPSGGNYTVTPSKAGCVFTPASRAFTNLTANQTADFTAQCLTISGNITSGGAPLANVTVSLSGSSSSSTTTDTNGNYSFANLIVGGNYTVTPTLAGFAFTPANRVFNNLTTSQVGNFTAMSTAPAITSIYKTFIGTAFLQGFNQNNTFTVNVNWNGTPGRVRFQINSFEPFEVVGNSTGASHPFNMNTAFVPAFTAQIIRITPINGENIEGSTQTEILYVFPHIEWLTAAINSDAQALTFTTEANQMRANFQIKFPTPDFEAGLDIPSSVPIVSGRLGIKKIASRFTGFVTSVGNGQLAHSTTAKWEGMNQEFDLNISGSGTMTLADPVGLSVTSASFNISGTGTLRKEAPLLSVVPGLAGLGGVPIIRNFNEIAKLKGEITPTLGVGFQFKQNPARQLVFDSATGSVGLTMKAIVSGKFTSGITLEGWVSGGADMTLGVGDPTKSILRDGNLKFEAGAKIKFGGFLNFQSKYARKCSWVAGPGPATSPVPSCFGNGSLTDNSASNTLQLIRPKTQKYGKVDQLSVGKSGIDSANLPRESPAVVDNSSVITNVFADAEPTLVRTGGNTNLMMWVRQNSSLPVLQSTDISWSYFNGSGWSSPVPIRSDTQAEMSPVAAVTATGQIVACWLRIKDPAFTGTITTTDQLPQFYRLFEVVSSVFNPVTQSWGPITVITDDFSNDTNLRLVSDGSGKLLLSWHSNPNGGFDGDAASPSTLKYSFWNVDSWSPVGVIASGLVGAGRHSAAVKGNAAAVVLPLDPDLNTPNNSLLLTYIWNGSSWSSGSIFASSAVDNLAPSIRYSPSGVIRVVWLRGTDLVEATLDDPSPVVVRSNSTANVFSDMRIVSNSNGKAVLFWEDTANQGPANIFVKYFDPSSGTWGQDILLHAQEAMASASSGILDDSSILKICYLSTVVSRTTTTATINGELVEIPNVPVLGQTDIRIHQQGDRTSTFDFDGDARTDLSIFRPNGANGAEWWWLKSSGGNGAVQFGGATDNIVAADYTGDGKTDVAFWRPATGQWFVLRSEDLTFYAFPFGANGDVPVPGDFDGDGKADAAVFRTSNLTWYISKSSGGTDIVGFGASGDKPVVADYDGDGKADIAVFRPNGANGAEWWIRRSSNATVFATQFGSSTDKAVPADYTGDGKADIAFWTPSSGNWFVLRSEDFSYFAFPFGSSTDVPTPGDYDGDGKTDAAVFRPSNSTWYAQRSTAGLLIQQFGAAGDVPVPSAYVR